MSICPNCGADMKPDANFCSVCGERADKLDSNNKENTQFQDCQSPDLSEKAAAFGDAFSEKISELTDTSDSTYQFDPLDIAKNKLVCVFAYISWLVLIPLLLSKDSPFTKFHANQGLVLAIVEIAWWLIQKIIKLILFAVIGIFLPGLYSALVTLLGLVNFVFVALSIIGIINVLQNRAKELPLIGAITILR